MTDDSVVAQPPHMCVIFCKPWFPPKTVVWVGVFFRNLLPFIMSPRRKSESSDVLYYDVTTVIMKVSDIGTYVRYASSDEESHFRNGTPTIDF